MHAAMQNRMLLKHNKQFMLVKLWAIFGRMGEQNMQHFWEKESRLRCVLCVCRCVLCVYVCTLHTYAKFWFSYHGYFMWGLWAWLRREGGGGEIKTILYVFIRYPGNRSINPSVLTHCSPLCYSPRSFDKDKTQTVPWDTVYKLHLPPLRVAWETLQIGYQMAPSKGERNK